LHLNLGKVTSSLIVVAKALALALVQLVAVEATWSPMPANCDGWSGMADRSLERRFTKRARPEGFVDAVEEEEELWRADGVGFRAGLKGGRRLRGRIWMILEKEGRK